MALLGALFVGACMGLLGSGGSILTIPILVYLVKVPEKIAIAEATAIVGTIALVTTIPYALRSLVRWRVVLLFGIPGMMGSYLGAVLARYVSGSFQLLLLASIMLVAAYQMARPLPKPPGADQLKRRLWKFVVEGLGVGVFTGLTGVGGGFLIVPALVLLGGLPMIEAVGTSLAIISMKSLAAYFKYLDVLEDLGLFVDGSLILQFASVGLIGAIAVSQFSTRIPQQRLRQAFAGLVVAIAIYIVLSNLRELTGGLGALTS